MPLCFFRESGILASGLATVVSDRGATSPFSRVGDSVKYGDPGGDGDAGSDGF